MQNSVAEARQATDDRIVTNLGCLIEHVHATMRLIEAAIAREAAAGSQESAGNIIVLDDVTPRYVKANSALNMCTTGLAAAIDALRGAAQPARGTADIRRASGV
jgi:hypothetical protein